MKIFKIGQMVYCVNKNYSKNKEGAKVVPVKVVGYQNIGGNVLPILMRGKIEYFTQTNKVYDKLEDALEQIK